MEGDFQKKPSIKPKGESVPAVSDGDCSITSRGWTHVVPRVRRYFQLLYCFSV